MIQPLWFSFNQNIHPHAALPNLDPRNSNLSPTMPILDPASWQTKSQKILPVGQVQRPKITATKAANKGFACPESLSRI